MRPGNSCLVQEQDSHEQVASGSENDREIDVCWSSDFWLGRFSTRRRSSAASQSRCKDRSTPDTWRLVQVQAGHRTLTTLQIKRSRLCGWAAAVESWQHMLNHGHAPATGSQTSHGAFSCGNPIPRDAESRGASRHPVCTISVLDSPGRDLAQHTTQDLGTPCRSRGRENRRPTRPYEARFRLTPGGSRPMCAVLATALGCGTGKCKQGSPSCFHARIACGTPITRICCSTQSCATAE